MLAPSGTPPRPKAGPFVPARPLIQIVPKPFRTAHIAEVLRLAVQPAVVAIPAASPAPPGLLGGLRLAVAGTLLLLIVALLAGVVPTFFGYEAVVVLSGSMAPALEVGDLAVIAPVAPEALRVGDVVSYHSASLDHPHVTNRLVAISAGPDGSLYFQTKGDANTVVDPEWLASRAIVGRLAYTVPHIGYLAAFARQPLGQLLLIVIPGLLLALDYLRTARR